RPSAAGLSRRPDRARAGLRRARAHKTTLPSRASPARTARSADETALSSARSSVKSERVRRTRELPQGERLDPRGAAGVLGPDDAAAREGEADGGGGFAGEDPDAARRERDAANRAADAEDDGAVARGELRGGDARDGDAADLQAVVGVVPGDPIGAAVAAEHGEDARRERDREWDAVGLGLADERSLLGVGDLDRRVPARRRSAGLVHPRRLDEGDPAGGQREVERRDAVEQRRRLAVGDDLDPAFRDRLLGGASRGATERIDVLDLYLRVGERRAAADDVAEPPAGAVALVGEPVDLYLATAELRLHHVVVRNRAVLVQRPEGGRRAGGERDLRLADRQIPVAGHARG